MSLITLLEPRSLNTRTLYLDVNTGERTLDSWGRTCSRGILCSDSAPSSFSAPTSCLTRLPRFAVAGSYSRLE